MHIILSIQTCKDRKNMGALRAEGTDIIIKHTKFNVNFIDRTQQWQQKQRRDKTEQLNQGRV